MDEERDFSQSSASSNRPKSKTKREKDKENKKKVKNMKTKGMSSKKSSSEMDEKDILTDTDGSSNWVTESQVTISNNNEDGNHTNTEDHSEAKAPPEDNKTDEGSMVDIKSLSDTYTVVSESDDNHVVLVPDAPITSAKVTETEGAEDKFDSKNGPDNNSKTERPRGDIPNSTGAKPYLRSHSGSWKNLRKRRQLKSDKISASLPIEQPFQPNLSQISKRQPLKQKDDINHSNDKPVELPKLKDEPQVSANVDKSEVLESSPLPPVSSTPASLPASASSGRISRSIENVISKLDRRSMSVLPHIGKSESDEGESDEEIFKAVHS